MAPYNPPNTHYSQFYWLTSLLSLDYLWYDRQRKVVEVWGPYFTHFNDQAEHVIKCELDFLKLKSSENKMEYITKDAKEAIQAC
jgi:hypothetical protein